MIPKDTSLIVVGGCDCRIVNGEIMWKSYYLGRSVKEAETRLREIGNQAFSNSINRPLRRTLVHHNNTQQ